MPSVFLLVASGNCSIEYIDRRPATCKPLKLVLAALSLAMACKLEPLFPHFVCILVVKATMSVLCCQRYYELTLGVEKNLVSNFPHALLGAMRESLLQCSRTT
jgi:hypothetical protein